MKPLCSQWESEIRILENQKNMDTQQRTFFCIYKIYSGGSTILSKNGGCFVWISNDPDHSKSEVSLEHFMFSAQLRTSD